jgi:hypothetical protein
MAIDFQKVTGSFEVEEKTKTVTSENHLAFGSFESTQSATRSPASVQEKTEVKKAPEMNEITGSFE